MTRRTLLKTLLFAPLAGVSAKVFPKAFTDREVGELLSLFPKQNVVLITPTCRGGVPSVPNITMRLQTSSDNETWHDVVDGKQKRYIRMVFTQHPIA